MQQLRLILLLILCVFIDNIWASLCFSSNTIPQSDDETNPQQVAKFNLAMAEAEKGKSGGMYEVAWRYAGGQGTKKDAQKAFYWYRKATENGHHLATYFTVSCLLNGNGVTKDPKQAAYWLLFSAELGNVQSMMKVADLFKFGINVDQSPEQALYWYLKAIKIADENKYISKIYQKELKAAKQFVKELKKQGVVPAQKLITSVELDKADYHIDDIIKGNTSGASIAQLGPQTIRSANVSQLPNLSMVDNSISFVDTSGLNVVMANGSYIIRFRVANTGLGPAKGCTVRVTAKGSMQGITLRNISLPVIASGEEKTVDVPIVSDANTINGKVEFSVQVDEPNGFGTDPQYVTVNTRAFDCPQLQITDYTLTVQGGGTLKKKQPFDLQLMLQNIKDAPADDVQVNVVVPQNVLMIGGNVNETIGKMDGGETKSLVYSLIVNNNYQKATIPITVHVKERYGKYAEDRTINLQLDQMMASAKIAIDENRQLPKKNIVIASLRSDIDKDIPTADVLQEKTFAVIIANEHYQMVEPVMFASNDGTTFEAYCRQTLGIPQTNIHMVTDATLNGLKYQIDWLKQVMDAYNGEASAIFYYAGHGIPDENDKTSYLLPVDGYGTNVSTGYSLDELYHVLGSLPARSVTVFLDACFSGTKRDGKMLASARGVAIKAKTSMPQGNMVVFSAAQGDETAYPYQDKQHGMFTYYLLKKLKDTKGLVSLGDLSDYVTSEVKRQSIVSNGKMQTPIAVPSLSVSGTWKSNRLR